MLPSVLQFLIFSVALIWLLDLPDTPEFTLAGAAMSLTAVALGNLLLFLINFPIDSIAFWADNVWSLRVGIRLLSSLLGGLALPLSIFPTQVQPLLEALPFRYLFDFPARLLLGEIGFDAWVAGMATCLAWCLFFAALSWVVWQRGRRIYTGIGI